MKFDPLDWLNCYERAGGGYALTSGRKLCFLVAECDDEHLTSSMAEIVGQPDRLEALRATIEARSLGELA